MLFFFRKIVFYLCLEVSNIFKIAKRLHSLIINFRQVLLNFFVCMSMLLVVGMSFMIVRMSPLLSDFFYNILNFFLGYFYSVLWFTCNRNRNFLIVWQCELWHDRNENAKA